MLSLDFARLIELNWPFIKILRDTLWGGGRFNKMIRELICFLNSELKSSRSIEAKSHH